jgi:hypothetical protein
MRASGLPQEMEMCVMDLDQETGTVLLAASPITNDALNVSDADIMVLRRIWRTVMSHKTTQHLNLTMRR